MARHLITSALPYINGVKHLGNLVGSMLPADVYARFMRQQGHDVLYICATDEHGTPTEIAAAKAGQSPRQFCDENYEIQKNIYAEYNLSFDYFGRTSSQQNVEITQDIAKKLEENGLIEVKAIDQIYSHADERFLPDRYVEGECPHCGYDKARGDQCENCTKLLDPTDLINPRSAISGSTNLEVRKEKHLYLKLADMEDKVRAWVDTKNWTTLAKSIAYKWLDEGLQDRCITRDLDWGVPVLKEGFEKKVFYVWFDAPIGYISATKQWADAKTGRDWKSWWYDADDVTYTQFMGKDNVPFHAVMFPATLLGSGQPWTMVDQIKSTNWLTYYGGKFSTSQGLGVFTDQALKIMPADYWRYYLMSRTPESDDSAFTWEDFQSVINKDLADVLGNYVNRLLTFTNKKWGAEIPAGGAWGPLEEKFVVDAQKLVDAYTKNMQAREFRKSLQALRAIWVLGNAYLAEAQPWTVMKEDPEKAAAILRLGINFIDVIAVLSAPVVPTVADKLVQALGTKTPHNRWVKNVAEAVQHLQPGHKFNVPDVLFTKLSDEEVAELEQRFGGNSQAA